MARQGVVLHVELWRGPVRWGKAGVAGYGVARLVRARQVLVRQSWLVLSGRGLSRPVSEGPGEAWQARLVRASSGVAGSGVVW